MTSKTLLAKAVKDARTTLNGMKGLRMVVPRVIELRNDEVTTIIASMGQTSAVLMDLQDKLVALYNATTSTTT